MKDCSGNSTRYSTFEPLYPIISHACSQANYGMYRKRLYFQLVVSKYSKEVSEFTTLGLGASYITHAYSSLIKTSLFLRALIGQKSSNEP